MQIAKCPACGAQVEFRSKGSVMAVCGFCRSTLVRHDLDLENLGKMAELAEDHSPLRLGLMGRFRSVGFRVIGRLQLQYADGYWNEWHCLFDDGRTGWVSEGSGLAYVTFEQSLKVTLPSIDHFRVGQQARLGNDTFTVTNIEHARCVAGEGELPFKVGAGWDAPAVDLRSETRFASIDYSDSPPKLYLGVAVEPAELFKGVVQTGPAPTKKAQARQFKCQGCGGPLQVSLDSIRAVACRGCGTIVDPQDPNMAVLGQANARLGIRPLLEIGSQGKFRGAQYTILGFMRRRSLDSQGSETGTWDEYLLHAEKEGFRWLTDYHGHWNFAKAPPRLPTEQDNGDKPPKVSYHQQRFRYLHSYLGQVIYVVGEFNWRVKLDDVVGIDDYIAPPLMLSREQSQTELNWTLAEYVNPTEISEAFKLANPLPEPRGVGPNQPSPHQILPFWLAWAGFSFAALIVMMVFTLFSANRTLLTQRIEIEPKQSHKSFTSQPFHFDGGNILAQHEAVIDNSWLAVDLTLIDNQNGRHYQLSRELSYFHGVDEYDGSSWSEGQPRDQAMFGAVPEGDYVLEIEAETEQDSYRLNPISDQIKLVSNIPLWGNFWLLLIVLSIVPLIAWWRAHRFERRRLDDHDEDDD
ncbi:DUF4178 domain-containing protein [Chitinimonas lacunae]|uniref:DUF4178 domain-containing protein n=1 Tax=Chitinimonas lacunae TaxID=1963018 RepID=A0ABV8MPP2_9NEIS